MRLFKIFRTALKKDIMLYQRNKKGRCEAKECWLTPEQKEQIKAKAGQSQKP